MAQPAGKLKRLQTSFQVPQLVEPSSWKLAGFCFFQVDGLVSRVFFQLGLSERDSEPLLLTLARRDLVNLVSFRDFSFEMFIFLFKSFPVWNSWPRLFGSGLWEGSRGLETLARKTWVLLSGVNGWSWGKIRHKDSAHGVSHCVLVLASFMSTWHKLESFWEMSAPDWLRDKPAEHFLD